MKVLFISRKFPPSVGGMELFARDLLQALGASEDVKVVAWGGSNKYLSLLALPSLFFRSLPVLLHGDVDVVHAHDGIVSFIALPLARLFRKPLTVVIHGLDITYPNPLYQAIIPKVVARADRVICISQATADQAIAHGVAAEKVSIIPIAVQDALYRTAGRADLEKALQITGDTPVITTVGRLVARKGVAWFIADVLPQLVLAHPKAVYAVVGDGPDRAAVKAAINSANMAAHVQLLGRINGSDLAAIYNGADVFVMPNVNVPGDMEGFGLVLLEAALCARPIVAAKTEGILDAVVDGKNGRLVTVRDAAGFAAEINKLLDHPSAARAIGQANRNYTLQHFSWPAIAADYATLYKALIK